MAEGAVYWGPIKKQKVKEVAPGPEGGWTGDPTKKAWAETVTSAPEGNRGFSTKGGRNQRKETARKSDAERSKTRGSKWGLDAAQFRANCDVGERFWESCYKGP